MSIVTQYSRSRTGDLEQELIVLDVARHLWSKSTTVNADLEDGFKARLTTAADVLTISSNAIPNRICYRITNNGNSVVLSPVQLNNNISIELRALRINLPDRIRSNCFVINEFTNPENETCIVIDLITSHGMTLTIIFKLSDFVKSKRTEFTLSSSNYQDWCKITNSYGFDIRVPHMLHSFSFDYSVVFLKDGGVIGLQKNRTDFSIEPIIYNDNSYFESLSGFFKPWSSQKLTSSEGDLSLKAVIDVAHFKDFIITISINKRLRIWSVTKQSLVVEKDLTDVLSIDHNILNTREFFDSTPSKLLNILSVNDHHYLTLFLPYGVGYFKIFELASENINFINVQDLGTNFEYASHLEEQNSIWLVSDFQLIHASNSKQAFELWVLWKSNTSSIIQKLQINEDYTREWVSVNTSLQYEPIKNEGSETWSEYYMNKIFESNTYSNEIVETVVPIFEKHVLDNSIKDEDIDSLDDLSVRERVVKTVGKSIRYDKNYDNNIRKQWSRFDSLCKEFRKHLDEPLNFFIEPELNMVFVINRQNFTLIRKSTNIELLSSNRSLKLHKIDGYDNIGDHLGFLNTISNFRKSISSDVLNNVRNKFYNLILKNNSNHSWNESLNLVFEEALNNKFNSSNLTNLINELRNFGDIFKLIDDLISLQSTNTNTILSESFTGSRLTEWSLSFLIESLIGIVRVGEDILFDILVLLLVLEFGNKEELSLRLSKILSIFKNFQIFYATLSINFTADRHSLEFDEVPSIGNSLFAQIIRDKFSDGFQVNGSSLNDFINYKVLPFINSNELLYSISSHLILNGCSYIMHSKFLKFFEDSPVFKIFRAIVYLNINEANKSKSILVKNSQQIIRYKLTAEEQKYFAELEDYSVFFHTSLSKYYLNLAILFLNKLKFQAALEFIKLSIVNNFNNEFDNKYLEQKYYTLFTIAIEISNFELAKTALNNISDAKIKDEALSGLVYKMYKIGDMRKINELQFNQDLPKIDQILLTKSRSYQTDIRKSLFFYQVLYAFRLNYNNYRGALEALYEFINKFESTWSNDESFLLTVAGIYSIILNLLITLREDDQWIIKHIDDENDDVLNYQDIKEEYYNLINSFPRTLREKHNSRV